SKPGVRQCWSRSVRITYHRWPGSRGDWEGGNRAALFRNRYLGRFAHRTAEFAETADQLYARLPGSETAAAGRSARRSVPRHAERAEPAERRGRPAGYRAARTR